MNNPADRVMLILKPVTKINIISAADPLTRPAKKIPSHRSSFVNGSISLNYFSTKSQPAILDTNYMNSVTPMHSFVLLFFLISCNKINMPQFVINTTIVQRHKNV